PRRQGGVADLRRLRLPDRLSGGTALPGRQDHRDLRRNQRDPATGHRFGLAQGMIRALSLRNPDPRRDAMGQIQKMTRALIAAQLATLAILFTVAVGCAESSGGGGGGVNVIKNPEVSSAPTSGIPPDK